MVLAPGQLLPVWNLDKWRRIQDFTARSFSALRYRGHIVTLDGDDPHETVLSEVLVSHDSTAELERARLSNVVLGNIGGERVVRPDDLPIGVLPMEGRWLGGKPALEVIDVSVVAWADQMQGLQRYEMSTPPRLEFFVAGNSGEFGRTVVDASRPADSIVEVRRTGLPFSWSSAQELGLLTDDPHAENQLALSIAAGMRKRMELEDWDGEVFLGYDLVGATGVGEISDPVALATYLNDIPGYDALYDLPFIERDPMAILNNGARESALQLQRGTPLPRRRSIVSSHADLAAATA